MRVTAWILRFVTACRARSTSQGHLTTEELVTSEKYWLSITQKQRFGLELAALQAGRDLPKTSRIRDLHPFLDEGGDGLLRIQTRLRNVVYHEGIKHPILLPGHHIATELIATGSHRRLLHAGSGNNRRRTPRALLGDEGKSVREKSDRAVYLVREIKGEACDGSYGGATC
ncbi:hypothetical protein MTO96_045953 [Rhipicephalus appendiculatus]